ncbi:unnamed protein product [Natator depressus]
MNTNYYWPGMTKDIADWVSRCLHCQKVRKELKLDTTLKSIKYNRDIGKKLGTQRSFISP